LPYALSLARRAAARLELVLVHEPLTYPDINLLTAAEDERKAIHSAQEYLNAIAQRVTSAAKVSVGTSVLRGRVADAICDLAARSTPDLTVLTTHGRGGLSRFWLGSVATDLIRHAPTPLLLVRPRDGSPDLSFDPPLQRTLIPLDGSSFAEHVIPFATAIGRLTAAQYRLLRVVSPLPFGSWNGVGMAPPDLSSFIQQMEAEARDYLTHLIGRTSELAAAQTRVVVDMPPARVILADADANSVDLIAIATRGRGGLARFFAGSVADKVIRGATIPVLVRRPPGA
jgi:nucleotide-binding universal stress UspA family protein